MNKIKLMSAILLLAIQCQSQEKTALTIEQCYTMARQNYPLLKQMALISKTNEYNIANASKGYLPQLSIAGQATYQSEVTKLPISLPNVKVEELSRDQYKIYGEISQSLTDPLIIKQQKELLRTGAAAETEKLEVELYKLKERINQLYFGVLLIDGQIGQTELLKKDIQSGLNKTNAAIANGTSLRSNADLLNAEFLKAEQKSTELKAARKGYTDMLSTFINKNLDKNDSLLEPQVQTLSAGINRPELKFFEAQKKSFTVQNKLILAKNLPRLGLFFQGGYGRPTLNMLSNDFGSYYIGGARLNWNLSGFYTYKKDKQLQDINQSLIDVQKETFVFNTSLSLKQQSSEVDKLSELMLSDKQIIALRGKVKAAAGEQLTNGTITANDYLNYVTAEDQARQNLLLHRVQLLMAQYNYQATSGN